MKKIIFFIWLCFLFVSMPMSINAQDGVSKEAMQKIILDTLRENPQIIFDIIRNNSDVLLDTIQQASNQRRFKAMEQQWKKDLKEKKNIRSQGRIVRGNEDAQVKIVAFSDFTCHYCQKSKATIDSILKEFDGKVCFIFKSIPLEEKGPSLQASLWFLAIANQNEESAWKFYDTMFSNREKLLTDGDKYIQSVAKGLKLNYSKLEKDVKYDKKIKNILREDREDADNLGVEGTPCFFVNNIVVRGAVALELFRKAIQMALKDVE